jgi:hypothetical protein
LIFGSDICSVDAAGALVMGVLPEAIPLINGSFHLDQLPLTASDLSQLQLTWNGEAVSRSEVMRAFQPGLVFPTGWRAAFRDRASPG